MRSEQGARLSLIRWQTATTVLLFVSYASYYFARVNLSATAPLLIADFHAHGLTVRDATLEIGALASLGTLVYAFGKFFLTWTGDFFGGKRSLLLGMAGAIAFTTLFACGNGIPVFTVAWVGNRLFQSIGWAGLVKVSSKWYSYASYGSVMAILSMSFLVGDAVTRGWIGALIGVGLGWRTIFLIAAASLTLVFFVNLIFLRESSESVGFDPPEINPLNVFGAAGNAERPPSLQTLLRMLLRSKPFLIVCALSFGTTLLRETLSTWTPTYFVSWAGLGAAQAAAYSALGPTAGVVSVLAAGWLSDRMRTTGRARVSFVGLALAAISLGALGLVPKGASATAIALIAAVALFNTGPYSYLAGAMALDFGGRSGSAMSSGIIDGVGYLGGALAGVGVAHLALAFGWSGAFFSLAAVTGVTALCAAALGWVQANDLRAATQRI